MSMIMVSDTINPGENNGFNMLNIDTDPWSHMVSEETKEVCSDNNIRSNFFL